MKRILYSCFLFLLVACQSNKYQQPSYYGERPLMLDEFDFRLDQDQFFPLKFVHPYDHTSLIIPKGGNSEAEFIVSIDTVKDADGTGLVKWIEYCTPFWDTDTVAMLGSIDFPAISMAIDPKSGEVMLLGGHMMDLESEDQLPALLETRLSQFGSFTKSQGNKGLDSIFGSSYSWEWNGKLIRLCAMYHHDNYALEEGADYDSFGNAEAQEDKGLPSVELYLFITKKEHLPLLLGKMKNIPLAFFQ